MVKIGSNTLQVIRLVLMIGISRNNELKIK
jgi:hypothetical protein